MAREIDLSNVNRVYTLLLLKSGPRHGYGIISDIEDITGERPTTSHIYPFIEKLLDKEIIEVVEKGDRGKKIYGLTSHGEEIIEQQLDSFSEIMYAAIEDRIEECSHCSCKIYEGGYEEDGKVYCCEHCARSK
ncbi:helix-turn-helix transcriptional regulator [Candidatus Nanosalina sp. VS9-1]|uniref:helix-turn-helix transcriptional regulator n=1 Tax=Candidatus Nanosalina sp. VS9-1 TaxID=3388566 RepID=UPI0039DF7FAB